MPFAIITRDKPGHAHVRDAHQAAHKRYLDAHKHLLLAAGAVLDDDGGHAHGGILLVDVETREEAEEFLRRGAEAELAELERAPYGDGYVDEVRARVAALFAETTHGTMTAEEAAALRVTKAV